MASAAISRKLVETIWLISLWFRRTTATEIAGIRQRITEGILAVQVGRRPLSQAQHILELAQADCLVQHIQQAHAGLTDGNGNTQAQQPFYDGTVALGHIGPPEDGTPELAVIENHVEHRQHGSCADAEDRRRRAVLQWPAQADDIPCQRQADDHLEKRLNKL